ncbi:tripartite-type tricarboxylate transporter receptor subunit TctC [Humitalea rosea]|uniref:Tripartite-type tricarboxylate transporter receptor subunit TctC n=1 Tax=Humitalea rosea TaxID=990373 RepID=A0A2W7IGE6_9PROT|nr:tripartite tricarboxylate transporter substrate-binding protein [Humitalea rosea]PZW45656.1 tripartite-type tricarboxylate transporter receptor subunit TctC [Humitalea rosea]
MTTRRIILAAPALAFAGRAFAQPAAQPTWAPDRPIRLIVPYAAGGPTDVVARLLAERLSAELPQRVLVENRAGGGAMIGTEAVAHAPKDGSALLFTTVVHAVHRALQGARLPFDPAVDFAPVALVGVVPMVLLVGPRAPWADMPALLAALRAANPPLAYGSSGTGGSSHLGVELLKSMTGVQAEHIPYRGTAPALQDLLGGRISLLMDSVATGAAPVRAGTLRGLATTGAARSPALPEVPTLAETVPGFVATTWNAILAPAGTPPATVAGLSAAIGRALSDPALAERLAGLGVDVPPPEGRTPEATASFISAETAKWTRVIETAGIKAE